ncbi:Cytosolic nonspecific dipeptidase [Ceratobasidium theobromae]|uniref:Cytosolic nonspecific dipeptidase n=1 Tax=Ceratobasidium theobromae TaxID=1582974 RepID=A0A5N5QII0_9AGAM|nr:Cytosolic nonspecific dipeptidase [Ceratobasidium theobromae]
MTAAPREFLDYVDAHKDAFVQRLSDAIAIPSVSGDASYRKHVHEMGHFVQRELNALGVDTKLIPLGPQELDGQTVELPPVVIGRLGDDKSKKTVLVYAHYDVQPALLSDGWTHDPFVLTHDKATDRLYGRGTSDDKGPLLAWINVLEAHKKLGIELPVNMRFCFEGMEESGSEGLDDFINAESKPGKYFDGVDCVCISDNYWLNDVTPCLTYGLRGISYFKVNIQGPAKDLHSGLFGNCVHEPMTDLFHLFSKLVTPHGKILIPGINELVAPLTAEERARYERIDYSIQDINESVGASIALSSDKAEVLMGKMRYPSLSIHGIEGAFSAAGAKTVIPAKISGKFSIRLVPDMTPENVDGLVIKYLEAEFAKLGSKNKMTVENLHGGKPYVADPNHWNFVAAAKATEASASFYGPWT